jgi:hypothetical protein
MDRICCAVAGKRAVAELEALGPCRPLKLFSELGMESTHQAEEKQKNRPTILSPQILPPTTYNCKMSTFGEYFRVTTYVLPQLTCPAAQNTS